MIKVDINNCLELDIPSKYKIKKWILQLQKVQNINNIYIGIIVVKDSKIQTFNKYYRKENKTTDILSFPFHFPNIKNRKTILNYFVGDIMICPNIIEYRAKKYNKISEHHWCHVIIHGILHLLGYDHIKEDDSNKMQAIEIKILNKLNIGNPYN